MMEHAFETPGWPADPPADWLTFHLVHPGPGRAVPGADPNCAFFWAGRYHLHYMYLSDDGYAFAHVSSPDMVHWTWHPTTLTPSRTGHGIWSGTGFLTKDGRPAMIYHGHRDDGSGRNELAFAEDDALERWTAPTPVVPRVRPDQDGSGIAEWDPDAWLEGDAYDAIFGRHPDRGNPGTLLRSTDLTTWDYLGPFLARDLPEAADDLDLSCPNFFPIGDRHMLLCISHNLGCRYYLGEWKDERFTPEVHGRMNWRGSDLFASESVLSPDGRRVMWAWCRFDDGFRRAGSSRSRASSASRTTACCGSARCESSSPSGRMSDGRAESCSHPASPPPSPASRVTPSGSTSRSGPVRRRDSASTSTPMRTVEAGPPSGSIATRGLSSSATRWRRSRRTKRRRRAPRVRRQESRRGVRR